MIIKRQGYNNGLTYSEINREKLNKFINLLFRNLNLENNKTQKNKDYYQK